MFSFYGNVHIGKDLSIEDLKTSYDIVIIAYGAGTDKFLDIEGINLKGSVSATELVAWYNDYPDYIN